MTAVHYLDRDTPQSQRKAPAAALAYARAAAQRNIPLMRVGSGRTGRHARFLRWRCGTCRCWSPRPGVVELVDRSARLVDLVAIVAYEHRTRSLAEGRRGGLQQQWFADTPVDVPRAGARVGLSVWTGIAPIAAVVTVDSAGAHR